VKYNQSKVKNELKKKKKKYISFNLTKPKPSSHVINIFFFSCLHNIFRTIFSKKKRVKKKQNFFFRNKNILVRLDGGEVTNKNYIS